MAKKIVSKPSLIIKKQESLVEEDYTKNGTRKVVKVVVKNSPFLITLTSSCGSYNFGSASLDVNLHYDNETKKCVDYLKKKPVEYIAHVSKSGKEICFETKISVLTSQHENNLFKIYFDITDKNTGEKLDTIISEPIRVTSRVDNSKKLPRVSTTGKKRSFNEAFEDRLNSISKQQEEFQKLQKQQLELLQTISDAQKQNINFNNDNNNSKHIFDLQDNRVGENFDLDLSSFVDNNSISDFFPTTPTYCYDFLNNTDFSIPFEEMVSSVPLSPENNNDINDMFLGGSGNDNNTTALENSFKQFLNCFNSIPVEERESKIRKIVSNISVDEQDTFDEVKNSFNNFGNGVIGGSNLFSYGSPALSDSESESYPSSPSLNYYPNQQSPSNTVSGFSQVTSQQFFDDFLSSV